METGRAAAVRAEGRKIECIVRTGAYDTLRLVTRTIFFASLTILAQYAKQISDWRSRRNLFHLLNLFVRKLLKLVGEFLSDVTVGVQLHLRRVCSLRRVLQAVLLRPILLITLG